MNKDVTGLLLNWSNGDRSALDDLMPLVYDELRRLAARYMRAEKVGHTLQPTALVHDAYLRLIDQTRVNWQNRAQFFGIAAQMIRRILVDHARARQRLKRGGADLRVTFTDDIALAPTPSDELDLVGLDHALSRLEAMDARLSRVIELRFFGGLSIEETAEAMQLSPATVKREWSTARAWLYREIGKI